MNVLKQSASVLVLLVAGGGLCTLLEYSGVIHFQFLGPHAWGVVSGDPPVTVSDGSLHAHSAFNWLPDASDGHGGMTIMPRGATGASGMLRNGCGIDPTTNSLAAKLWTDSQDYPIDPGATVTITHDPDNTGSSQDVPNAAITIQVPTVGATGASGVLSIHTITGNFAPAASGLRGRNNRQHSRAGEVSAIQISSSGGHGASGWAPANARNPHFTLGFCYY